MACGLADSDEAMRFEELDRADVAAGLVDPPIARIDRVALQRGRAHCSRVRDCAVQQSMHEPQPPEPRPYDEADHRPDAVVLDVRNRP